MKVGLTGFPGAGKTTVFRALTGLQVDAGGGSDRPNLGVIKVPDARVGVYGGYTGPQASTLILRRS